MNASKCPACQVKIKYKDEFAGRKMRCPKCGHVFGLPRLQKVASVSATTPFPDDLDESDLQLGEAPRAARKAAPVKGKKAPPPPPEPEDVDDLLAAAEEEIEPTSVTTPLPKKGKKGHVEDLETEEFSSLAEAGTSEDEGVVDWMEEAPPPPAKGKGKKPAFVEEDEELLSEMEEEPPTSKAKGKGKKAVLEDEDEEPVEEDEAPPVKSKGKKPIKGKKADDDGKPRKKKGGLMLPLIVLVVVVGAGAAALIFILQANAPTPPLTSKAQADIQAKKQTEQGPKFKDTVKSNSTLTPDRIIALTFSTTDGKSVQVAELAKDKHLVLVFTRGRTSEPTGYSPLCVAHTAALLTAHAKLVELGAAVLIVHPASKDDAKLFLDEVVIKADIEKLPCDVAIDPNGKVVEALGIKDENGKSATFVLNKKGQMLLAYVGNDPDDRPSVAAIQAALQAPAPMIEDKKTNGGE